jgi:tetratricopeptide (TPR) repeat protein
MKVFAIVTLVVTMQVNVAAQEPRVEQLIKRYEAELQSVRKQHKDEAAANTLFYIGRLQQEQAKHCGSASMCADFALRAIESYEEALRLSPMSAGSINNLAMLYADRGDVPQASKLFARLIGIDTPNSGRYALNYASFLKVHAGLTDAKPYFEFAMTDKLVGNEAAQTYGAALLDTENHDAFVSFALGQFVKRPSVVQELALRVIAENKWPDDEQLELLEIIVAALTHQEYAPEDFGRSPIGLKLTELESHSTLGRAISEIFAIHRDLVPKPSELRWWANTRRTRSDKRTASPHQAFRSLIIHIGDLYSRREEHDHATRLYYAAAFLSLTSPDPDAFFKLAESYYTQGTNPDVFYEAVDRYEPSLYALSGFQPDFIGRLPGRVDLCSMIEFHRKIGILSGLLAMRASPTESEMAWSRTVAEFERARGLLKSCSTLTDGEIDPYSVGMLSTGYARTRRPYESARVRLEAAEAYIKHEKPAYAATVIKPIEVTTLKADDRARLEMIFKSLAF